MERKGEKGSEEDDYFNKFPPTMPSVVLENRSIRMFKVSYQSAPKKPPCFLSLIPIHPSHYLSSSFLSVILTTSPSFIPFNPPLHYLFSFL
jgi:hypothetical protein